jgi:hypothetical protein
MAAMFEVVDQSGAFIALSSPYTRLFVTSNRSASGLAYLLLTVKTGYGDPAKNATVLLNGVPIGSVEPRLWTNHFVFEEEAIILPFGNATLQFLPLIGLGFNTLQIVPTGTDPDNYVILGSAICHYLQ